jgi:hypothetical protein
MLAASVTAFVLIGAIATKAQIIVPATDDTMIGQNIAQLKGGSLPLIAKGAGAPTGSVWIASTQSGLLIYGAVQEQEPHFAVGRADLLASDHVEVWLAAAEDPKLPPIGWGNQFGETDLASPADCDQMSDGMGFEKKGEAATRCRGWYDAQVSYRASLLRLFARQWVFSGDQLLQSSTVAEMYAAPAYAQIDGVPDELASRDGLRVSMDRSWAPPAAGSKPGEPNRTSGFQFSLFVPWQAFPPQRQLSLRDLRLKVDVFAKAPEGRKMGPYATTAPLGEWGKPATFNKVRLGKPHEMVLSPCGVPLEEEDQSGNPASWFVPPSHIPDGTGALPTAQPWGADFVLENPVAGYMYEPGGRSPEVAMTGRFWRLLNAEDAVCGPKLAMRRGGRTYTYQNTMHSEGFSAHRLSDGWLLVRSGPVMETLSPLGSGQCGSCPVAVLQVFAIDPRGKIATALDIHDVASGQGGQPEETDISFADDWSRVTLFEEHGDEETPNETWSSKDFCLVGHDYKSCGKHEGIPKPKVYVPGLRQDE